MNEHIQVTKRNGITEPIDMEKIHRVVHWASQDLWLFLMVLGLKIFMKPSLNQPLT